MNDLVYADHNASVPICARARDAVIRAMEITGNPSSIHRYGRGARRIVESAREAVARLLGASASETIFTAGATEANQLALSGQDYVQVLVSAVEHESVLAARPDAVRLPVDERGVLRLDALEAALSRAEGPALVSLMLANNETGVVQPVAAAARIARAAGARVHCDAVQAVGRLAVDIGALGVDYLSLSAHKIGGPAGVGALVTAPAAPLMPLVRGGGQERGRRGGTENLAGIAGFGAAAEAVSDSLADQGRQRRLRDELEARIAIVAPGAQMFGSGAERIANTSCLEMPGVASELQVMSFDLAGIAVSAGSACSSGKVAASHVLQAMGVAPAVAASAIRISLGTGTTEAHIDRLVDIWTEIFNRRRVRAA